MFTGFPIVWYGMTDLEFPKANFLADPALYQIGPNDVHMNTQLFLANIFNAIGNAYFIALICFYAMDGAVISRFGINGYFWQDSTLMLCIVVMVVNLRIFYSTSNHTLAGTIIITLSTFSFFA